MPRLAGTITVDMTHGAPSAVLIDGEPFPYYLAADPGIDIHPMESRDGISTVTLTIPADRVRVIPE
ncbi:hypothetical protein [Arthrobacter woluwensis]|uniref:hypothetical protein n=1 Tax=Arthrobacter woluwensis TaxID=156980 RepID=UPI001AAEA402|nr:hypothetical protein [Arthrobacter woluwensis]QTF71252.1 hypothetical protein G8758_03950 [Arthrobacter woluwensis]